MMNALIVGALVLVTLFAVAPAADASPIPAAADTPCTYSIGTGGGYVACCDVNFWVNYGSAKYVC
jgi:hypothetical protein